jgi:hypothetical protein
MGLLSAELSFVDADDWHAPETYRWSASVDARLLILRPRDACILEIELLSWTPSPYSCEVLVNGSVVERFDFPKPNAVSASVPIPVGDAAQVVCVTFRVPSLWIPSEVIGSHDSRQLGIAVKSVAFVAMAREPH